jgi:hypothetical protein
VLVRDKSRTVAAGDAYRRKYPTKTNTPTAEAITETDSVVGLDAAATGHAVPDCVAIIP